MTLIRKRINIPLNPPPLPPGRRAWWLNLPVARRGFFKQDSEMNVLQMNRTQIRQEAARIAIGGLAEYEFEIEMLGHNYPAIASYEIDSDGLPEIHRVEIGRLMPFYDIATERMTECRESVDMTRMLDSDQLALIAEDILASLREAETDNRISRYELTRSERLAA